MKKAAQTSESIELGILLALSGGLMDAYSYLVRGKVFANAQTGNILLLGINLSQGNLPTSFHYLFPVLSFTIGIAIAQLIRTKSKLNLHWRQLCLCLEIVILCFVGFIGSDIIANSLTSLACGIQVQSFRKIHGNSIATTMCIGNLRSATENILSYANTKKAQNLESGLIYFFIILCFVFGAILGNTMIPLLGQHMILISPALLIIAFIVLFIDRERPRSKDAE